MKTLTDKDFQRALVRTMNGLIKGIDHKDMKIFKGIPYAKPPVGKWRWSAPVPIENWSGVRSAMHFGSEPIQGIDYDPAVDLYGIASGTSYSEDCLYLNIYTPAKSADAKLPVLFWIHGGGFNSGASSQTLYPGEMLAKKGNMIVVTTNYRLGIWGFFSHSELDSEQNGTSGNYGLMDQAMALKWVKENIAAFGGNPDAICIGGQSAGAISVGLQLFNREVKGLFTGAIIQSGPILEKNFPIYTKEEAQEIADDFLHFTGSKSVAELRELDAWQLFEYESKFRAEKGAFSFWPCIDENVLEGHPIVLIKQKRYHPVNLLCGTTSEEFIEPAMKIPPEKFVKFVNSRFGTFADKMLHLYTYSDVRESSKSFVHLLNDSLIWESLTMASDFTNESEKKAYCYYFTRPVRHEDAEFWGAPHSAELPFLFQRKNYGGPSPWHECMWTEKDMAFSDEMIHMWSEFVHGHRPKKEWESFNTGFVMELGEEIVPLNSVVKKRIGIQSEIIKHISANKLRLNEIISDV